MKLVGPLILTFVVAFIVAMPVSSHEVKLDPDKVLVTMYYSETCKKWCKEVRPVMAAIVDKYGDKVAVREMSVGKSELENTKKLEKDLGIPGFHEGVFDYVPCVAIFSKRRKLIKEVPGAKDLIKYSEFVDKALSSR